MNKVIVVVGPRCWGRGPTLKLAVARAQANYFGESPMPYNAYEASEDAEVDGMGTVSASALKRVREVRVENGVRVVRVGNQVKGD